MQTVLLRIAALIAAPILVAAGALIAPIIAAARA